MRLTVTIDQSNDDPEDVIADPAELATLVREALAHEVARGRVPHIAVGGYAFTIDPDAIEVEPA